MTTQLIAQCPRCGSQKLTANTDGLVEQPTLTPAAFRGAHVSRAAGGVFVGRESQRVVRGGYVACDRCEWAAEITDILSGAIDE